VTARAPHRAKTPVVRQAATPTPVPSTVWRDLPFLVAIAGLALAFRLYLPWDVVFAPTHLNLLETDGWYHLRAIESFVRNFPHHLTFDPYVVAGGQYVALAPLFDILVGTAAWAAGLGHPSPERIGVIAAHAPVAMGVATVLVIYAAGRAIGNPRAGLLGATLAATLPGHFLDRTLLGFVDHHALEALISSAILWTLLKAARGTAPVLGTSVALGGLLAAYALAWTSASFLFAVIFIWLAVTGWLDFITKSPTGHVARVVGVGGAIALALVWLLQDPGLYRRDMQLLALAGLTGAAGLIEGARLAAVRFGWPMRRIPLLALSIGVLAGAAAWIRSPVLADAVLADLVRFTPSPDRMQVLEARPLFLYLGNWSLAPAWEFFRSGFIVGLAALAALTIRVFVRPTAMDLLLLIWGAAMYAATLGQNRFGYYLVPIAALLGGWICASVIDAGRRAQGIRRTMAVVAVAALVFTPSLVPAVWTTGRPSGLPASWVEAFDWLRIATPEPFDDPAYYFARYSPGTARLPQYAVLAWWDAGYWITQIGRRVPIANPTQAGAAVAGQFFAETDEGKAVALLDQLRVRYVMAEENLPFIPVDGNALLGKFESVVTWAGLPTDRYYEQYLVADAKRQLTLRYMFTADYYRSMAFRLVALGGAGVNPSGLPVTVVTIVPRTVPGITRIIPEVTASSDFATFDEAEAYRKTLAPGDHRIVGRNPTQTIVSIPPLRVLRGVFRTAAPGIFNRGAVRIYETCGGGLC
jgi:oligosaccharyl transferase (archaeosortase A-associated)